MDRAGDGKVDRVGTGIQVGIGDRIPERALSGVIGGEDRKRAQHRALLERFER